MGVRNRHSIEKYLHIFLFCDSAMRSSPLTLGLLIKATSAHIDLHRHTKQHSLSDFKIQRERNIWHLVGPPKVRADPHILNEVY